MKYGELNLGQIEAIVNKLGGMNGVSCFLSGNAEVVVKKHVIDCDVQPSIPKGWKKGWKVEEHQKGGQFVWDATKVNLYLSDGQKDGKVTEGNKLRKEMKDKPVLNANVLDYLLANPHLIPEEWKGNYVEFWGTVYSYSDGDRSVRCLYWDGRWWHWCLISLGQYRSGRNPAALRAS